MLLSAGADMHVEKHGKTLLAYLFEFYHPADLPAIHLLLEHIDACPIPGSPQSITWPLPPKASLSRAACDPELSDREKALIDFVLSTPGRAGDQSISAIATRTLMQALDEHIADVTPGLVRTLVDAGADLNERTGSQLRFPLWYAAEHNRADLVREMIALKADPHLASEKKYTALHVAADHLSVDVIRILRNAGAWDDEPDLDDWTPSYRYECAMSEKARKSEKAGKSEKARNGEISSLRHLLFRTTPITRREDPLEVQWEPATTSRYENLEIIHP